MEAVTYSGIAASLDGPINGARGRRRKAGPIDLVVGHLWVSPEDGPDRYLRQLATPNLPGVSGRVFQSRDAKGRWLWEAPNGSQTTNQAQAKPWPGKAYTVFRSKSSPYYLTPGGATPWTFGAGYHGVAGTDAEPHWACDPELYSVNANPPVNDRAVSFCLPGRLQTRHDWLNVGESRDFIRAFAKAIAWANQRWGVPLVRLTAKDVKAGKRGYCDHWTINQAYGLSDHVDLGSEFPWDVLAADIDYIINGGDMARIVHIYEDTTWLPIPNLANPDTWLLDGPGVKMVTAERAGKLAAAGTARYDPNGKPGGIWRSALGAFDPPTPVPTGYDPKWFHP